MKKTLGLALSLMLFSAVSVANVKVVVLEINAPELAGEVQFEDPSQPADGAMIQLCARQWKDCAPAIHADQNGRFRFEGVKPRSVNYLYVRWKDANQVKLELRIDKNAPPLVLVLHHG